MLFAVSLLVLIGQYALMNHVGYRGIVGSDPPSLEILLILSLYVFPCVLGVKSEEHLSPKPKMLTSWKLSTGSRLCEDNIDADERLSPASVKQRPNPECRVFHTPHWPRTLTSLHTSLFSTATIWLTPLEKLLYPFAWNVRLWPTSHQPVGPGSWGAPLS